MTSRVDPQVKYYKKTLALSKEKKSLATKQQVYAESSEVPRGLYKKRVHQQQSADQ